MAVGNLIKSGSVVALAAALAVIAAPVSAQERGQGRWGGGGRGGEASQPSGGGNNGGGASWRGREGGNGGGRGFRSEGSAPQAQPQPQQQPQAQAQPQRNWSRGGGDNGGGWNRGSGGSGGGSDGGGRWSGGRGRDTAQTPVPTTPQAQPQGRNWQRGNGQAQDWNRGATDRSRNPAWRGNEASRNDANRWRNDNANNSWRNNNNSWRNDRNDNGWRGNTPAWRGDRQSYARNWNRDWRRDNRYDWRGYRTSNRNVYRLGTYYAPYRDYSYRRLSTGFYLDSLFFGSRYLINDPWQYRLPPADGPFRWVRYYDDALLVDTYSGEVVDVIYDFFW